LAPFQIPPCCSRIDQLIRETMTIYVVTPSWHVFGIQSEWEFGRSSRHRAVPDSAGGHRHPRRFFSRRAASTGDTTLDHNRSPRLILAWSKRRRGPAAHPDTPLDQMRVGCATRTPGKPARASDEAINIGSLRSPTQGRRASCEAPGRRWASLGARTCISNPTGCSPAPPRPTNLFNRLWGCLRHCPNTREPTTRTPPFRRQPRPLPTRPPLGTLSARDVFITSAMGRGSRMCREPLPSSHQRIIRGCWPPMLLRPAPPSPCLGLDQHRGAGWVAEKRVN
jgi:hypothetical protein